MPRNCLVAIVSSIVVLIVGFACESRSAAAEETEILKITVGKPTLLHPLQYQNAASISGSRTGVVAAFYPAARRYRTSADGGVTWGPAMDSPAQLGGGSANVALRDGGVLKIRNSLYNNPDGIFRTHRSPARSHLGNPGSRE